MEYFNKMSAQVEAHGLRLYSVFVGTEACVWQGDDAAGREAEIGRWCTILRALGEVGIGWCGYNFKWGNQRTESAVGRGGSTYSTFVLDELQAHGENMSPVPLTVRPGPASRPARTSTPGRSRPLPVPVRPSSACAAPPRPPPPSPLAASRPGGFDK